MKYLDRIKFGKKEKEDSMLAADTDQEVASEEQAIDAIDETEVFDDLDGKKKLVEEWWLQSDVADVVEEEPEEEEKDEEEKKEKGETDDLIYNLTSGLAMDDEEENIVLRKATEAMGEISADELLELGRTVLQEMGFEVGVEKSE
jgi:hypothetical protein